MKRCISRAYYSRINSKHSSQIAETHSPRNTSRSVNGKSEEDTAISPIVSFINMSRSLCVSSPLSSAHTENETVSNCSNFQTESEMALQSIQSRSNNNVITLTFIFLFNQWRLLVFRGQLSACDSWERENTGTIVEFWIVEGYR